MFIELVSGVEYPKKNSGTFLKRPFVDVFVVVPFPFSQSIRAGQSIQTSQPINPAQSISTDIHRAWKSEHGNYGTQENTGITRTQHTEVNNTHII